MAGSVAVHEIPAETGETLVIQRIALKTVGGDSVAAALGARSIVNKIVFVAEETDWLELDCRFDAACWNLVDSNNFRDAPVSVLAQHVKWVALFAFLVLPILQTLLDRINNLGTHALGVGEIAGLAHETLEGELQGRFEAIQIRERHAIGVGALNFQPSAWGAGLTFRRGLVCFAI